MARTLVIPDADFSTHKIETVSFDPVPPVLQMDWAWRSTTVTDPLVIYSVLTGANANKYITAFGYLDSATEHELPCTTEDYVPSPFAIKIPNGTTKIKVSANNYTLFYDGTGARICWAKDVASGASGEHRNKIKGIERENFNNGDLPLIFTVPQDADAFVLTLRFDADYSSTYGTANAIAEHVGVKIEFLTD